jgi:hypothetical protein
VPSHLRLSKAPRAVLHKSRPTIETPSPTAREHARIRGTRRCSSSQQGLRGPQRTSLFTHHFPDTFSQTNTGGLTPSPASTPHTAYSFRPNGSLTPKSSRSSLQTAPSASGLSVCQVGDSPGPSPNRLGTQSPLNRCRPMSPLKTTRPHSPFPGARAQSPLPQGIRYRSPLHLSETLAP